MADKDLLYFNQTLAQWQLVNAGAISDGTIVITPDKINFQGGNQTVVKINAVELENDTRTTTNTYNSINQLTKIEEKDGSTVVLTEVMTYNTNGTLATYSKTAGGQTVNYTYSYNSTSGNLTGITKTLS